MSKDNYLQLHNYCNLTHLISISDNSLVHLELVTCLCFWQLAWGPSTSKPCLWFLCTFKKKRPLYREYKFICAYTYIGRSKFFCHIARLCRYTHFTSIIISTTFIFSSLFRMVYLCEGVCQILTKKEKYIYKYKYLYKEFSCIEY